MKPGKLVCAGAVVIMLVLPSWEPDGAQPVRTKVVIWEPASPSAASAGPIGLRRVRRLSGEPSADSNRRGSALPGNGPIALR